MFNKGDIVCHIGIPNVTGTVISVSSNKFNGTKLVVKRDDNGYLLYGNDNEFYRLDSNSESNYYMNSDTEIIDVEFTEKS